jgi:hypothetical protein
MAEARPMNRKWHPSDSRKQLVSFAASLEELVVDALDLASLTESEREDLRRNAEQLTSCVEALANVIDTHDAKLGFRRPYVGGTAFPGHDILYCALTAAYKIGSLAIQNPILTRLTQVEKRLRMANARAPRLKSSEAIDEEIVRVAGPIWKTRSIRRRSPNAMASAIDESFPALGKDALRKRLKKLIASGRLDNCPPDFRTDGQ